MTKKNPKTNPYVLQSQQVSIQSDIIIINILIFTKRNENVWIFSSFLFFSLFNGIEVNHLDKESGFGHT